MTVTGLTAEFNPFHNGHAYILKEIKKRSDAAVVVMSGSFVQRGDAAVTDKYTRAEAALKNGADLVIELPVIYALSSAGRFAYGAVRTLAAAGIVDNIAFGAECDDIELLWQAADALCFETAQRSERIKRLMSSGMSYPSARAAAYPEFAEILSKPNNILAVEYLRALSELRSDPDIGELVPRGAFSVKRTNDFHSLDTGGRIISAAAVREVIAAGGDISAYVPDADFDVYSLNALDNAVTYLLRTSVSEDIAKINDVGEGLENRIIAAAAHSCGFADIAAAVKSKRYTMSRIRRILISVLLGLDRELCMRDPSYIRILGMNNTGKILLREMKKKAALPVIIKTADFKADDIFRAEIRAAEAAALCRVRGDAGGRRDYTVSPRIV